MSASAGCTTLPGHKSCAEKSLVRMLEQRPTRAPISHRFTAADADLTASALARPLSVLALAAMLAATFAMPAGASDRWFTAEIIVFDDLRNEGLRAEHWPADPGEPSLRNAVELTRPHEAGSDDAARAYRLAGPSELSLNAVRDRLRRTAHYRPFLHVGWRLPGLPRSAARPAHVSPRLVDSGAGDAERVGGERPTVHGTVTVSLARYLQVEVDLLYSRPASGQAVASNTAPTRFRLVSQRRMRSGELHYIDHPLFGVLILLTPL